jgi:hypothetical protein
LVLLGAEAEKEATKGLERFRLGTHPFLMVGPNPLEEAR